MITYGSYAINNWEYHHDCYVNLGDKQFGSEQLFRGTNQLVVFFRRLKMIPRNKLNALVLW